MTLLHLMRQMAELLDQVPFEDQTRPEQVRLKWERLKQQNVDFFSHPQLKNLTAGSEFASDPHKVARPGEVPGPAPNAGSKAPRPE